MQGHVAEINCVDVPNGVDLNYFNKLSISRSQRTLIFVGGLNWYPNYDAMKYFLSDIWPLLLREIPDVNMKIVGASPPQWMLDYASQYKNLSILGFVDDVRPYLSEAHIYVCPIRDGGGTKLKVLDALAMEIPLVADPIACEGIDVVDGQSVLFASDPKDYVSAVKKLISDDKLSESLAREGRLLIERLYSFREIGKKLAIIYQDI
ncbi:MAG: glycosyltransferase [Cellvibrio sp.]|nr:glycosyltransferase [Cellvibrio sp.]